MSEANAVRSAIIRSSFAPLVSSPLALLLLLLLLLRPLQLSPRCTFRITWFDRGGGGSEKGMGKRRGGQTHLGKEVTIGHSVLVGLWR